MAFAAPNRVAFSEGQINAKEIESQKPTLYSACLLHKDAMVQVPSAGWAQLQAENVPHSKGEVGCHPGLRGPARASEGRETFELAF